jgi:hypothetical protein
VDRNLTTSETLLNADYYNRSRMHFSFPFGFSAAKRPCFDLKEKQCLNRMENGARGHPTRLAH